MGQVENTDKTPMTPQQQVNVCMGEIYRYRLAVKEQLPRISEARDALEKTQPEKAAYVLQGAQGTPPEQFYQDLSAWDMVERWRLRTEIEFFLGSAYGLLLMARKLKKVVLGTKAETCVATAVSTYESAVPDATLFRHVLEHFDEYAFGGGRDRKKLPVPDSEGGMTLLPDGDIAIKFGGMTLTVRTTAQASDRLSNELQDCMMEPSQEGLPEE